MPQKRNNQGPPQVMTWSRATPVLTVAIIFDFVRLIFEWFWFFGPAFATIYCTAKVGGVFTTWTAGILGAKTAALACSGAVLGVVAGATAITGGISAEAITVFGIVMAMAVGLLGWLTVGIILFLSNERIFKENAMSFVISLMISETPIIGSLPAITISVWRMYHNQIKIEKAALKKWEKENADAQAQERNQQALQIRQIQNAQWAQIEEQEAANEELYAKEQAANENVYEEEEIPDEMRKAA
jgi:hypothetical protein